MGEVISVTLNGKLFLQIVQLVGSFHEVIRVERWIPDKPISETDCQFFIYLKNGKKFELRYGVSKSGIFEGYYFKHPKFNKGEYISIYGVDRVKAIRNFLKLNFAQSNKQNRSIFRLNSKPTQIYKINSCKKCGGSGYIREFRHVQNGICFACNKDGHKPIPKEWVVKVDTQLNLENF